MIDRCEESIDPSSMFLISVSNPIQILNKILIRDLKSLLEAQSGEVLGLELWA